MWLYIMATFFDNYLSACSFVVLLIKSDVWSLADCQSTHVNLIIIVGLTSNLISNLISKWLQWEDDPSIYSKQFLVHSLSPQHCFLHQLRFWWGRQEWWHVYDKTVFCISVLAPTMDLKFPILILPRFGPWRPRNSWRRDTENELRAQWLSWVDIVIRAQNRAHWRETMLCRGPRA